MPATANRGVRSPAGALASGAGSVLTTAGSAAVRAVGAVGAGFFLTAGLALALWAVTPTGGTDPAAAVKAGVVALAAAHFLPVTIDGAALTLRPLMLTAVMIAVIVTAVGRGRRTDGRLLETVHAAVFALAYGLGIDIVAALASPSDAVAPALGAPLALAALCAAASLALGPTEWHRWWVETAPPWAAAAVRATGTALGTLATGAGLVTAVAMVISFPTAVHVSELTIGSLGDGAAMVLLGLAFVPNVMIAAVGYVTGAGFSIGAASFSPLAVHTADLPAIPFLAAVPAGPPGPAAVATMAVPVLAALVAALVLRRAGGTTRERALALAAATVAVGTVVALLCVVGGGGVAHGPWARAGAPPIVAGGLAAAVVLLVGAAVVLPGAPRGARRAHAAVAVGEDGTASKDAPPDPHVA